MGGYVESRTQKGKSREKTVVPQDRNGLKAPYVGLKIKKFCPIKSDCLE